MPIVIKLALINTMFTHIKVAAIECNIYKMVKDIEHDSKKPVNEYKNVPRKTIERQVEKPNKINIEIPRKESIIKKLKKCDFRIFARFIALSF